MQTEEAQLQFHFITYSDFVL